MARVACPTDRRVTFVSLTDEGRQMIESIFPSHEEKIASIFDVLSDEELQNLTDYLKRVGHHANKF